MMHKLFHSILSSKRKFRGFIVGTSLWLLRIVRDVEEEEIHRIAHELRAYDWESESASMEDYTSLEEEDMRCDCALGLIERAKEDLDYAYWGAKGKKKKC
jgi:hypothetical protein